MIIISLEMSEPLPDSSFIVVLNERLAAKWPECEFSITLVEGKTRVEFEPTIDAPTEGADPHVDDVYRFVMDAWVDFLLPCAPEKA